MLTLWFQYALYTLDSLIPHVLYLQGKRVDLWMSAIHDMCSFGGWLCTSVIILYWGCTMVLSFFKACRRDGQRYDSVDVNVFELVLFRVCLTWEWKYSHVVAAENCLFIRHWSLSGRDVILDSWPTSTHIVIQTIALFTAVACFKEDWSYCRLCI